MSACGCLQVPIFVYASVYVVSVCVCPCVHVCMRVCLCMTECVQVSVRVCPHTHMCMSVCVCLCVCVGVYVCLPSSVVSVVLVESPCIVAPVRTARFPSSYFAVLSVWDDSTLCWFQVVGVGIRGTIVMREIVHVQAGQCGNQIGAKVFLVVSFLCGVFNRLRDELSIFVVLFPSIDFARTTWWCSGLWRSHSQKCPWFGPFTEKTIFSTIR